MRQNDSIDGHFIGSESAPGRVGWAVTRCVLQKQLETVRPEIEWLTAGPFCGLFFD